MSDIVYIDTLLSPGGLESPLNVGTPMPTGLPVPLNIVTQGAPDTVLPLDPDVGVYKIVGSVNEAAPPTDTPRTATVYLIIQDRWQTIRMTHADPVTGYYEFLNLRGDAKYAVVAQDYNGVHLSVIADNLEATL
jgi:hypothetical protein